MAKDNVEKGPGLARGPALIVGAILTAAGLLAIIHHNSVPELRLGLPRRHRHRHQVAWPLRRQRLDLLAADHLRWPAALRRRPAPAGQDHEPHRRAHPRRRPPSSPSSTRPTSSAWATPTASPSSPSASPPPCCSSTCSLRASRRRPTPTTTGADGRRPVSKPSRCAAPSPPARRASSTTAAATPPTGAAPSIPPTTARVAGDLTGRRQRWRCPRRSIPPTPGQAPRRARPGARRSRTWIDPSALTESIDELDDPGLPGSLSEPCSRSGEAVVPT